MKKTTIENDGETTVVVTNTDGTHTVFHDGHEGVSYSSGYLHADVVREWTGRLSTSGGGSDGGGINDTGHIRSLK